jgi:hypothetical protein
MAETHQASSGVLPSTKVRSDVRTVPPPAGVNAAWSVVDWTSTPDEHRLHAGA